MTTIDDSLNQIQGEALAARMMGIIALRAIAAGHGDPKGLIEGMSAFADRSLSASTGVGGSAANNETVREVARLRIQDDLANILTAVTQTKR